MAAKYILAVLAAAFLVAGIVRGGPYRLQSRIWLLMAAIFGVVSGWLWYWH